MKSIKEHYTQLLSLTQLYLLREEQLYSHKAVDPSVLTYFQTKMGTFSSSKKIGQKELSPPSFLPQSESFPLKMTSQPPLPDPRPPEILPDPVPPVHPEPARPDPLPPTNPPAPEPVEPQPPIIHNQSLGSKFDSKKLSLELLTPKALLPINQEFWKLLPSLFPDLKLCTTIPSDQHAQKLKNKWLDNHVIPPVIILSFQQNDKHLAFLKNVAKAISLHLAPARVLSADQIEKEKKWETILTSSHLKLVIASDYDIYLKPQLMHFYKEVPQQNRHFLHQTPLLLLSDLSLYLKDPQLKSLLWRAIRNEFALSQKESSIRA